jgi:predicted Zn-dependent protease
MSGVRGLALALLAVALSAPAAGAPARSDEERQLWERAAQWEAALAKSDALLCDAALQSYLDGIATKIHAQIAEKDSPAPRVFVLRHPLINAFAAPNGMVVLHSGILARLENEAELATLLGHELAHFVRRHSLRETRERRGATRREGLARALTLGLYSLGGGPLEAAVERHVRGYSQRLELEADRLGFVAMQRAGYDVRASVRMFEVVLLDEEEPKVEDPFYYADHPSMDARAAHYRELIARSRQSGGELGAERYLAAIRGAIAQNVKDDLEFARVRSARLGVDRLLAAGGSAEAHYLDGEWLRLAGKPGPESSAASAAAYARAVELDAQHAPAWRALGLAQRDLGRAQDALRSLTRALELAPDALDRPILEAYVKELQAEASRAPR